MGLLNRTVTADATKKAQPDAICIDSRSYNAPLAVWSAHLTGHKDSLAYYVAVISQGETTGLLVFSISADATEGPSRPE